jgi:hypothetical protein
VIWKGTFSRLKFRPEEGMEVIATGRLTTYPGKSSYQIVIDNLEPAGAGALMALLEERRRKLAAEGLFDEARKRPIPYLPQVIGVVTSPTGAVIRDILHRLEERFPTDVVVWPVRVQGDGAAAEIAAGIRGFSAALPGARPQGGCLFASPQGNLGDIGYCAELCDCPEDCADEQAVCDAFVDEALEQTLKARTAPRFLPTVDLRR